MSSENSAVRVRFAPSPTGYLHVGGARTALFNWLFAKRYGGTFVLRLEDTDAARNTPEALQAIYDGLRWLGLEWDEGPEVGGDRGPYFQSQRQEIYARHLDRLLADGRAYEDGGAIRLRSPKQKVTVHDRICGEVTIDRAPENDTALRRSDGSYIFHFVNVVDDIEMGITHVIRGEDHLMNTPKHLEIFEALGAPPPVFAHIPLILNPDGSKMSKRDQGAALGWYQEQGFLPEAVRNFLCLLGWSSKDDREKLPLEEIIARFDFEHLNRSPAKFDLTKCLWLNGQYLAEKSPEEFAALAQAWLARQDSPSPWRELPEAARLGALRLVQPKIKHLPELTEHFAMLFDPAAPVDSAACAKVAAKPETRALLEQLAVAFDHLAADQWTAATLQQAVQDTAAAAGVKPGALLFPLRVAITGQSHGADLLPALELLGRDAVAERLRGRIPSLFGEA